MALRIGKIIIFLQIVFALTLAICLWFKVFLPYSYFSIVVAAATFLAISILKRMRHRYVLFQIFLIYLLISNVYGLSTHFSVLPYGDSYWEYAVVRTFQQSERVYTIPEQTSSTKMLTWYSGWPLIHTLAAILSSISGITPLNVVLLLPLIVSLCSFLVIYIFLEKAREAIALSKEITYLGLLIFALSPDAIFWRTQFVRMDFGLLWLDLIFYFVYVLISQSSYRKRRIVLTTALIAFSLIATHHFVSFIAIMFLLLLLIVQNLGKRISKTRIGNKLFPSAFYIPTMSLAILMLVCIFIWWDSFGQIIWPTVAAGTTRFIRVITGAREIELFVPQPIYPLQLTPTWALALLRIRDVAMLVPSLVGMLIFWIKKPRTPARFFMVYAMITFGLLFIVNDVTFKVEPFRLITLAIPFIALLTASAYGEIRIRFNRLWKIVLPTVVILLISTSFLGLWAHSFAPMHLYNPTIKASEVGEHTDTSRVYSFVNKKVSMDNLGLVWGDDLGSLILLLNTDQLGKIQKLTPDNIQNLGANKSELFCEFSDLNLYKYYASTYSPIKDPKDAEAFAQIVREHLSNNFDRIYDDGAYRFWEK